MLNRLLNELDGLRERADVFFVLTTNRAESLEPALTNRPGRIDQTIEFPLPDEALRERLVVLYAKTLPVPATLVKELAHRTDGASPAFIKSSCAASRNIISTREARARSPARRPMPRCTRCCSRVGL